MFLEVEPERRRVCGRSHSDAGVRADDAADEVDAGYEMIIEAAQEVVCLGKSCDADA